MNIPRKDLERSLRLLGLIPGVALTGAGIIQQKLSQEKALQDMKNDLVDAKESVKKLYPELYVATSDRDIKSSKMTDEQKFVFNKLHSNLFKGHNAAYLTGENPVLFAPEMVNKSLLGHELGHHIDFGENKITMFDRILPSRMEGRAWEKSPLRDDNTEDISKTMLGTYKGVDKQRLGIVAAIAGSLIAPLALKLMKK